MSTLPLLPVTVKQRQTLRAIRDLSRRDGYPPSYVELMAALGVHSKSVVAYRLQRCADLGLVTWEYASPRTVTLTSRGWGVIA